MAYKQPKVSMESALFEGAQENLQTGSSMIHKREKTEMEKQFDDSIKAMIRSLEQTSPDMSYNLEDWNRFARMIVSRYLDENVPDQGEVANMLLLNPCKIGSIWDWARSGILYLEDVILVLKDTMSDSVDGFVGGFDGLRRGNTSELIEIIIKLQNRLTELINEFGHEKANALPLKEYVDKVWTKINIEFNLSRHGLELVREHFYHKSDEFKKFIGHNRNDGNMDDDTVSFLSLVESWDVNECKNFVKNLS